MWFHLELRGKGYGSAYAGVATATKPTGPFTFLKAGRVNPGKWPLNLDKKDQTTEFTKEMPDYVRIIRRDFPGGQMSRDMTIFVDDNGKAYHIYSSEGNITLHIAELTPDYTGHNGKYVRVFVNRYMEAPAICKHNGNTTDRLRLLRLGAQRGPQRRGPPHGRTVDGAQKSLRGAQGQYHLRRTKHLHPARTGKPGKFHLHGGHPWALKRC